MTDIPVITIDGPAGSGKGTVAARLAKILGWHTLDSGALYRLTAYAAQKKGVVTEDEIAALAKKLPVRFIGDQIYFEDEEVSRIIRQPEIGQLTSQIAALPEVRHALLDWQRSYLRPPGLIADGRDMGSVVFPDANLKIFLDASPEERAIRRYKQLKQQGIDANLGDLVAEIKQRDERDRNRAIAPLQAAPDAITIDSTQLSIDQVVQIILQHWQEKRGLHDPS